MPELRANVDELKSKFGCTPSLAAILVGDDPASRQYVKNKQRVAAELGCDSRTVRMKSADATTESLLGVIDGAQRRRARQCDPAAVADPRFGRSLPPVRRDRAREGSRRRRLGQRRRLLSRSVGTLHSMHSARRADPARLLPGARRWCARGGHRAQRYRRQADRADSRRTAAQRDDHLVPSPHPRSRRDLPRGRHSHPVRRRRHRPAHT